MKLYNFRRKLHQINLKEVAPTQETVLQIDDNARIRLHLYKFRGHGKVVKYVYQLETFFKGKWRFVVRYNNFTA